MNRFAPALLFTVLFGLVGCGGNPNGPVYHAPGTGSYQPKPTELPTETFTATTHLTEMRQHFINRPVTCIDEKAKVGFSGTVAKVNVDNEDAQVVDVTVSNLSVACQVTEFDVVTWQIGDDVSTQTKEYRFGCGGLGSTFPTCTTGQLRLFPAPPSRQ